ncbi:MarR family winged helix-turn-helix transcriptional regulator [Aurantimonas sp. Leaf443]|uniref:MarR family winged helix-turn-helix transcriptional regulator n=1 Tax=Aurantimonas sp. Leaf443 TaxID=1736378 RepID=UPI0006FB700B|nr:MarR family winged helix-turn-helix transcriptional regulator [Aurantimonas sp. Leaf443]KQT85785.1 hypothetical protein ASG48_03965 [Aurantimonas sp. Leaf443]
MEPKAAASADLPEGGERVPDGADLAALAEQLSRRLHSQGHAFQLFPAQWAALRYVASAPPGRNTAIDVARHQGLAAGAVARSVRTLIEKGFLAKAGTVGRGRAEGLALTDAGRQALRRDPLKSLAHALGELGEAERTVLAQGLRRAIRATNPREIF